MSEFDSRDLPPRPAPEEASVLGGEIVALLGTPDVWVEPSAGLEDRLVVAIETEAAPFEPLAGTAAREAPGRSWVSALRGAAAVLVLLFGGIVVLSALDGGKGNKVLAVDLVPTGRVSDVSGSVEIAQDESGVRIDLQAVGLPRRIDGSYYEAWLHTADGELIPVGTFHDGTDVVLWGGIPLDDVVAFTITREGVAGVDVSGPQSSGDAVLKADLSSAP